MTMNKRKNIREFREDKVMFADKTKSRVPFKISKFTSSLKDSSPYSRIRVPTGSPWANIVPAISLVLFRRVDRPI